MRKREREEGKINIYIRNRHEREKFQINFDLKITKKNEKGEKEGQKRNIHALALSFLLC